MLNDAIARMTKSRLSGEDERLLELDRSVIARWGGHEILLSRGFVPVVRVFFEQVSQLPDGGLSPVEAMFCLQLMSFKWDEAAPYPSYALLAQRLGVSIPYVKKLAAHLEERGFLIKTRRESLSRSQRFSTNEYDLSPLFDQLAHAVRYGRRRT